MNPLFEILKRGSAIVYNVKEKKVKVFSSCTTFDEVEFVAERICELFGVDKKEVKMFPEKNWGMRFEFEYEFSEKTVEKEEKTEENSENNPEKKENSVEQEQKLQSPKKEKKGRRRFEYERDGDTLILRLGNRSYVFDYETVKEFFEELPKKVSVREAYDIANELGMNVSLHAVLALFEFFDRDVNFDAELMNEGMNKVLVKTDFSLREENRRRLTLEGEVIGRPWNV